LGLEPNKKLASMLTPIEDDNKDFQYLLQLWQKQAMLVWTIGH